MPRDPEELPLTSFMLCLVPGCLNEVVHVVSGAVIGRPSNGIPLCQEHYDGWHFDAPE